MSDHNPGSETRTYPCCPCCEPAEGDTEFCDGKHDRVCFTCEARGEVSS